MQRGRARATYQRSVSVLRHLVARLDRVAHGKVGIAGRRQHHLAAHLARQAVKDRAVSSPPGPPLRRRVPRAIVRLDLVRHAAAARTRQATARAAACLPPAAATKMLRAEPPHAAQPPPRAGLLPPRCAPRLPSAHPGTGERRRRRRTARLPGPAQLGAARRSAALIAGLRAQPSAAFSFSVALAPASFVLPLICPFPRPAAALCPENGHLGGGVPGKRPPGPTGLR
eukprot:COSAG06_NODE_75_length_25804_cov_247.408364_5_plen_227_part_00